MRTVSAPLTLRHRLVVAGAATVAFHAAVFGVVEWRLAVAADTTPEATSPMAVTVRLEAYPPVTPQATPLAQRSPAPLPAPPATTPPAETSATQPEATPELDAESVVEPTVAPARPEDSPIEAVPAPDQADPAVPMDASVPADAPAPPRPLPQPVGATRTDETPPPGGASSADRATPSIPTYETVRYTPPSYPEAARRAGNTGTVELVLTLSRRGTVTDVTVHRSSSVPELDRAAVRAAATWRFPRGEAGRRSIHRIRFDLEERP